jgi:hypothetical protein
MCWRNRVAEENGVSSNAPAPHPAGRKKYKTPRLEEYGHVAKLTQSGGSTRAEPGNPRTRSCL